MLDWLVWGDGDLLPRGAWSAPTFQSNTAVDFAIGTHHPDSLTSEIKRAEKVIY
jgi:hypothetical protein